MIAIAWGSFPTLIGPARRVARPTGVTVPETEFATKAVCCRCRARGRAVPADARPRSAGAGAGPLAGRLAAALLAAARRVAGRAAAGLAGRAGDDGPNTSLTGWA